MATRVAIFPGTFDPPHLGHVDVLEQAVRTFDRVVWAILNNPDKRPRFDLDTRKVMMCEACAHLDNVEVISFDGLLVDAARSINATHLVRSLRIGIDFDYEFPMTLVNRRLAPELITVYFPAQQDHFHISSSMVRQLISFGQDLTGYVPSSVLARL
ncbi:MAG TPA: pantetheine-phosphate adenylyltransferase [Verrucomicrobiae bacterium]|nr:pantetheine-phosphate adenylyltransferase [Verrucomicrobiae bacterium]